jgi:hypothetical protein
LGARLPQINRVHLLKKSIAPTTPAPTVGGIGIEAELLKMLDGGVDSAVAICVGTSEGTRTPDGRKTAAWNGHVDPGNGAQNQGSFSYQHSAASPKEADLQQIKKFKDVLLPKFLRILPRLKTRTDGEIKRLFLCVCDCFTQSEAACTAKGGFLDQISANGNYPPTIDRVTDCRVDSYYDPTTERLDAPGFGNSIERLYNDQHRRTEAVIDTAKKLGIF